MIAVRSAFFDVINPRIHYNDLSHESIISNTVKIKQHLIRDIADHCIERIGLASKSLFAAWNMPQRNNCQYGKVADARVEEGSGLDILYPNS